jgi:hypothetical protein
MQMLRAKQGFSQIETLCVIGLIASVLALLGGANWHVQSSMQVRNTATAFLQAVKTARQYAIDHRCRTRVVFRAGLFGDDPIIATDAKQRTYRIFAFVVPTSAPGDSGQWVAVPGAQDDAHREWTRVELTPRSRGLVGRWLPCDLDPLERIVPDAVKVSSPLFERFDSDEPDPFYRENFHTPDSVWMLNVADPHEPAHCFSVYPEDYWMSPTAPGFVLLTGELPDRETCLDPLSGEMVKASSFWPGHTQFIGGESGAMDDLPGIEFQPDGSLPCVWTRELRVSFAFHDRPQLDYAVLIDTATGLSRLEQVEVR